ncbi:MULTISPECIES: hypothetical protein [Mycobacterium]|uniref:Bacterial Pleckstrin homology domain-containing protein n=1 Tax=Mycobacterium kiyosense TaxID=2871094 RepID=A0A9P3UT28_9MYCO|nr:MULTISPECIES: hypothetical protein [Mycobacterium]BDB40777.1 hypothetical protein IWGMT90018_12230 [Mycobacterium kiyosense]BDE12581.1 hypothetical protein MKCMC460_14410 [Mycobacterium sp. 20KCMC460]GLB84917.1 hypothetical protein SRL2020028_41730 [Mycobacterium kiyosense]GLB87972.1 hypothetical protein SRL2020130_07890 [Mycobacterium kiyosense]GLB98056.1 hypothetical protein SRL2020226_48320 [Mycobacterium kiyosense]
MTALYEDSGLTLDEDGITIRRYYFPFANAKRIDYGDITSIKSKKMGWASGKGRIWGAADPRYWFPLDVHRGRKSTVLILQTGRWVRACITPDNPDEVIRILRAKVKI